MKIKGVGERREKERETEKVRETERRLEMELGGKRHKEKPQEGREVSVCWSVSACVQGWGRELLDCPPPQPALLTPSPTPGPSQRQGAGQVDNMLSTLVYLNHPALTVNSTS